MFYFLTRFIRLFRIISIPLNLLFSSARLRDFDGLIGIELPVSMYTTKTPIDMCRFNVRSTGTCFIKKIYAPSSSLLQGKHLPFTPSPLRLNIFRLFVILSLTQLYRYTPEIFLFSTTTFKYKYRAPLRRIGQEYSAKVAFFYFSVTETDTATSGLHWIFHMHSEFSRPAMCNNAIMIISQM